MTNSQIDKAKKKADKRLWHEANIEHVKAYRKKYNKENRTKINAAERARKAARTPEQIEYERARTKRSRDKRRESIREASRLDRVTKPEVHVLHSLRTTCRRKNMAFNLTPDDVIAPEFCPVLGIKLQRGVHSEVKRIGPAACSPSVDRIIPELGYVKGNVIAVSHLANRIRNDATPEQIHAVADFYEKLLSERGLL